MRLLSSILFLSLLTASRADSIDDLIRADMTANQAPGMALAIIRADGKPEFRTYGTANVENKAPVTVDTVFRWASLTKQFTSMSVHLLWKEGKLDLEAPLSTYLKDLPAVWSEIKLIHLLTHTAGIPDPADRFNTERDYTLADYIAMVGDRPLKWKPGAQFEYSNPGYSLLGAVVEAVSGVKFIDFVESRVIKPAGMKTARFYRSGEIVPNRAGGYNVRDGVLFNDEEDRPLVYSGSGGLMGSIQDLAAWDAYLRAGGPGKEIVEAMKTKAVFADGKVSAYGRGWYVSDWEGSQVIRHGGDTWGFSANMIRDETKGVTILILRNTTVGQPLPLARKIYEIVLKQ